MITTSKILQNYLNERNLSQVEIARIINVTPQYINAILNNKRNISKKVLKLLIKYLKITDEDIKLIEKLEIKNKLSYIDESKDIKFYHYANIIGDEIKIKNSDKYISFNNFDNITGGFFIITFDNNEYTFFIKDNAISINETYMLEIDGKTSIYKILETKNKLIVFDELKKEYKVIDSKNLKIIGKRVFEFKIKGVINV